jgi:hypothetical protein
LVLDQRFSKRGLDFKNGALFYKAHRVLTRHKKKRKLTDPVKCLPIKIGMIFLKDLEITFWTVMDIG